LHYHEKAQQFFFILRGIATFEVEEKSFTVQGGEGFHIAAMKKIASLTTRQKISNSF